MQVEFVGAYVGGFIVNDRDESIECEKDKSKPIAHVEVEVNYNPCLINEASLLTFDGTLR